MQNFLLPSTLAEDTLEALLAEHASRGQAIYLCLLLLLGVCLALLPVIHVPVVVRSSGILRPAVEQHVVRAGSSGVVAWIAVRENQTVRAGEVLAVLRTSDLAAKSALTRAQLRDLELEVRDLELLVALELRSPLSPDLLATSRYRQEYLVHARGIDEWSLREERARREAERAALLLERSLIPRQGAEEHAFAWRQELATGISLVERARQGWLAALSERRGLLREARALHQQLDEQRHLLQLISPVGGTVQQVASVSPGSFVQLGEQIAVVSPDTGLVADIYVAPRDIGLLRPGMPVRLHIDAFNHHDWGFVPARISEISNDILPAQQQPIFRVKAHLEQDHLLLRNGFRGRLTKGMTAQAHFLIARRSLLQLLRDDVNNWLHPIRAGTQEG